MRASAVTTAVLVSLLLGAAGASAAIRYAKPGGNDTAGSECPQSNPCSLFNAASRFATASKLRPGDEVIVEPGTYSSAAGELGSSGSISSPARVSIHGMVGQPLPVIVASVGNGTSAFSLTEPGQTLSRVEILASGNVSPWATTEPSGVIDGVVAVSSGFGSCFAGGGLVRNSVCLSTGPSSDALEALPASGSQVTVKLRNVTAIAAAPNSRGLRAAAEAAGDELTVDAIGVLVRGKGPDVFARSISSAKVTVSLSHSDFADIGRETDNSGATATITEPGSSANDDITAEPILAPDGYHELHGSLTIDAGATDDSSGTTDIDGESRAFGRAPDIGADEFQIATMTSLSCTPASVAVGDPTSCTATVSSSGNSPTGTVKLTSDGPGAFANGGACTLASAGPDKASCSLLYTPSALGNANHRLTASYQGDASNVASQGSATIHVLSKSQATPNTTLKKKPPRKSASRKATFTFASNQPGSRFQCKLDRKVFKPCRSPLRLKGLKPGRHTYRVRAVGPTGTADPTPASFRWNVSSR